MEKKIKKEQKSNIFILSTIGISFIIAQIIAQIIISPLVFSTRYFLDETDPFAVANFLIWAGLLITVIAFVGTVLILIRQFHTISLIISFIDSIVITIFSISIVSYIVVTETMSIYNNLSILDRFVSFFLFPAVLVIVNDAVSTFWFVSSIIFVVVFTIFLYYFEGQGVKK